jgi:hypothetical protein
MTISEYLPELQRAIDGQGCVHHQITVKSLIFCQAVSKTPNDVMMLHVFGCGKLKRPWTRKAVRGGLFGHVLDVTASHANFGIGEGLDRRQPDKLSTVGDFAHDTSPNWEKLKFGFFTTGSPKTLRVGFFKNATCKNTSQVGSHQRTHSFSIAVSREGRQDTVRRAPRAVAGGM